MPDPGDTSERTESSGPRPDGAGEREPDRGGKGEEPSPRGGGLADRPSSTPPGGSVGTDSPPVVPSAVVPSPVAPSPVAPSPAAPFGQGLAALRHLKAAQLRASAARGGLVKITFGTVFLVGALAHALSPQRHEQSSLFWITLLLLMSTVNVALGLRSVGRARRRVAHAWLPLSAAWGFLAVVLLGLLLRR